MQAEDGLGAIRGDARGHDHRLARVLDAIDQDHREVRAVETAFSQNLDLRRGGPDEVAADARFLDSVAVPCEVDHVRIIPSAHATDHAAEHGLGHGLGRLESGVGLQWDLAAPVGAPHGGRVIGIIWPARVADKETEPSATVRPGAVFDEVSQHGDDK
jgi:hypothetical protein